MLATKLSVLLNEILDDLRAQRIDYEAFLQRMALSDIERKRIEKKVGAFIEKRRPALHIRTKLDFGFRVSGQSVELFEMRPQWDQPEVMRESSFAKATFVRTQGRWKVYWKRADLKWHSYRLAPEVATIDKFLAVVQEDEYGCFFG